MEDQVEEQVEEQEDEVGGGGAFHGTVPSFAGLGEAMACRLAKESTKLRLVLGCVCLIHVVQLPAQSSCSECPIIVPSHVACPVSIRAGNERRLKINVSTVKVGGISKGHDVLLIQQTRASPAHI